MAGGDIFAPADMGFLKAVAMYDADFVGLRRTISPSFLTAGVGVLVDVSMDDEVLEGLALTRFPLFATADMGFFDGLGNGQ